MSHAGSATPIGTCAERAQFASITDCYRQSSGPQRGRRKVNLKFTGWNRRTNKSLPKFNLAPGAGRTNARNSWINSEFLRKLIFSLRCSVPRSGVREKCHGLDRFSPTFNFLLLPVIASTVGTAIEWYDFFLYSTVTGLVFAKLFFPNSDPWVGTAEAERTLALAHGL